MTQKDWYEAQQSAHIFHPVDEEVEKQIRHAARLTEVSAQHQKHQAEIEKMSLTFRELLYAWEGFSDTSLELQHEREKCFYNLGVEYGLKMKVEKEVLEGRKEKLSPRAALLALLESMTVIVENFEEPMRSSAS